MAKPITPIAAAASHASFEQSVPIAMFAAPANASATYAVTRLRVGPLNSTRTSIANDPKAANVATCASPITLSANANTDGITIAARTALRNDTQPGSRMRIADRHPDIGPEYDGPASDGPVS